MNIVIVAPIAMIIIGALIKIKMPKFKSIWGFKTRLSMANEENWKIAQSALAKWSILLGIIFFVYAFIIQLLENNKILTTDIASYFRYFSIIFIILLFRFTERDLKEKSVNNI